MKTICLYETVDLFVEQVSVPLHELNSQMLGDIYAGSGIRYNAIVDLLNKDREQLRRFIDACSSDVLNYEMFFASIGGLRFCLLECLSTKNQIGGMMSTYVHDYDRPRIEPRLPFAADGVASHLWNLLPDSLCFNFLFPDKESSRIGRSNTSEFMNHLGFFEESIPGMRLFFLKRRMFSELETPCRILNALLNGIPPNGLTPFDWSRFGDSQKLLQREQIVKWMAKCREIGHAFITQIDAQ